MTAHPFKIEVWPRH